MKSVTFDLIDTQKLGEETFFVVAGLHPDSKDGDKNAWMELALLPRDSDHKLCFPMVIEAESVERIMQQILDLTDPAFGPFIGISATLSDTKPVPSFVEALQA